MRTGSVAVGPQSSSLGGNLGAGVGTIESCWPQCWTYHMQEQSGISSQNKDPFFKGRISVAFSNVPRARVLCRNYGCFSLQQKQVPAGLQIWLNSDLLQTVTGTDPAAHALPLIQRHRFCPSLGSLCLNSCWQPLEGWEQIEEFVSKKWNWIYRNDFWITGQVEIFEKLISDKSRILFLVLLIK